MGKKDQLTSSSGLVLIYVITLVPIIFWLIINPLSEIVSSPQSFFYALGRLLGIVGFVLFAINMVLSVRARWLEDMLGGLNKVYKVHHYIGGLSLSFILFHPLFTALHNFFLDDLKSIQEVANSLLPKSIDFSLPINTLQQNAAFNAGILALVSMTILIIITFYVKLPYQIWLFTHKFLGVAFLLAAIHTLMISSDVSRNEFLFIYMFVLTVAGLAAYSYRTILGNVVVRRSTYEVTGVQDMGANNYMIELKASGKHKVDFQPGQFVFLRFKKDDNLLISGEAHPFSMASSPKEDSLRFYIKALGDYTATLDKLEVGQTAEIEGAFGKFSYTNFPNKSQVWIAGGIGVTPFLSMARSLSANAPKIDMFYSVKSKTELLDQAALKDFLPEHFSNFKYYPYVFDEQKSFLTAEKIAAKVGDLKDKEIFICGPGSMMKSLRQQFRQMGVQNRKIHSEEFDLG